MNELIKKILNELNIDSENGLASDENLDALTTYQHLFYTQAKNKIGVDAVYFLRDSDGIAKIPLIYFSMVNSDDTAEAAKLHRLSWNMGEAPLLFVVTPTELKIYNNYKTPQKVDGSLDPNAGIIDTINLIKARLTEEQKSIDVVPIVHGLLSRSILIKYLEERKDSNGKSVFPKDFYAQFCKKNLDCKQYTD